MTFAGIFNTPSKYSLLRANFRREQKTVMSLIERNNIAMQLQINKFICLLG